MSAGASSKAAVKTSAVEARNCLRFLEDACDMICPVGDAHPWKNCIINTTADGRFPLHLSYSRDVNQQLDHAFATELWTSVLI
jgi:hypothetical protein